MMHITLQIVKIQENHKNNLFESTTGEKVRNCTIFRYNSAINAKNNFHYDKKTLQKCYVCQIIN